MYLDWSANNFLEKIRQRSNEYEFTNTTKCKPTQQSSKVISSSDDSGGEEEAAKENKLILGECEKMLEQTQTLQMANPQLLRPEDYVRLRLNNTFLDKNDVMVKNARCSDSEVIQCKNKYDENNDKYLELGKRRHKSNDELIGSKGFCSYVSFVTSYIIFLVIVTFLLSRIGKI